MYSHFCINGLSYAAILFGSASSKLTTSSSVQTWSATPASIRGSNPQGLVDSAEIVVHEVERDSVTVILKVFRERIRKASETTHLNTHR
jgi:hypothetical protein